MFEACRIMHEFLAGIFVIIAADNENVVVVHCVAGKGRTGSLISAYLLFAGAFDEYHRAILYYKEKRKVGVTHPGQRRYIQYFQQILQQGYNNFKPRMRRLRCIQFYGIPNINNGTCSPIIDIYNVRDDTKILSEKVDDLSKCIVRRVKQEKGKGEVDKAEVIDVAEVAFNNLFVFGDIFVKVSHSGMVSAKKMFRLALNTNTVVDSQAEFTLDMLDPDILSKNPAYPRNFKVILFFEDLEAGENSHEQERQLEGAKMIESVLKYREAKVVGFLQMHLNVFGDPDFDDREEVMIVDKHEEEGSDLSGDEAN
jgi:phosphatidylinositol-3,4,5-trisphosphate 3-phosphatase/dual-specificity protein phosphatase PTEN